MQKNVSMLVKILILTFVLAIGVFMLTMAWFSNKTNATAESLSVVSNKTTGLEVSDDNINWSDNISYDDLISLPLITGNGSEFFVPALDMTQGTVLAGWQGKEAQSESDYIEKTIYLRSQVPMTVSVSSATVSPLQPDVSADSSVKSGYGNFSKDYIAATARIALFDGANTFVYDPNPKMQLTGYGEYTNSVSSLTDGDSVIFTDNDCYYAMTATGGTALDDMPVSMKSSGSTYTGNPAPEQIFTVVASGTNFRFKIGGMYLNFNEEAKMLSLNSNATDFALVDGMLKVAGYYLTYDGVSFTVTTTAPDAPTIKLLTSKPCAILEDGDEETTYYYKDAVNAGVNTDLSGSPVITLVKAAETDSYYTGEITIRIWAEGTDRDALAPLMGGKFKTEITLTGNTTTNSQEG